MQENTKLDLENATRFFANALHEIRTPIQTIVGAAELIQNTSLDKEQTEYVRQILFSAEGLLELANNILDLAKMNQNDFSIEEIPFDISLVVEHVVDSESVKAFNRGVELILDISQNVPALVTGDSMRVRQIMLNLISNAVKFTNEGYVHVELDYNKSDGIIFTVTDSGIGISEEKQKKLFTEYFQADISTYRLFGGTGLGLSISKNLVALMGGKIGVKANPDGGSIFWFTLPLPVAIEKSSKAFFCTYPEEYKILIVDDNELAALSLKKKLFSLGFLAVEICTEPKNALLAIEAAEKENKPFKILFIDMLMNESLDGWHLGFNIKNSKTLVKKSLLYLLVPEGQMHEDAKMKILNLYDGYLYKPIKKAPLISLLKEKVFGLGQLTPVSDADSGLGDVAELSPVPLAEPAKGMKILVAEDHPMNRKLLETFLTRLGAEVYLAKNGEEALDMIKNNPQINMVFMDIYMPEKNGIEATKEL
ncbi:MAG: response regulator, partial [Treponema sp.]|nr:response regulator [Treponema sp.]